jgi:hypothetical protein
MKFSAVAKAIVFTGALAALGCQDARPTSPDSASLFVPDPDLGGVWSGPMTRLASSGGECAGQVIDAFLPAADRGTITITQEGAAGASTITTESTGLACRYKGVSTLTSFAMNAESCDRTGLIVACVGGTPRELQLVGSSVTGSWTGDQLTGEMSSTYNVFKVNPKEGVDSLVVTHRFAATRR